MLLFYRKLDSIVEFTKKRAEEPSWRRGLHKQSNADDIKKWEKELTRAFALFKASLSWIVTLMSSLMSAIDQHPSQHQRKHERCTDSRA
jgi:hypothetical protein